MGDKLSMVTTSVLTDARPLPQGYWYPEDIRIGEWQINCKPPWSLQMLSNILDIHVSTGRGSQTPWERGIKPIYLIPDHCPEAQAPRSGHKHPIRGTGIRDWILNCKTPHDHLRYRPTSLVATCPLDWEFIGLPGKPYCEQYLASPNVRLIQLVASR